MRANGMTEVERQILINQSAIMAFLHCTHMDSISQFTENSFNGLFQCFQITKGMLEADAELKEETIK